MKFKSFLRKFFLGREVLEKVCSSVNGEILVAEDLFGRREMIIGRVAQSGGLVKKLWTSGLKAIGNKQSLMLRNKQSLMLRNKQSLMLRNKQLAISNCLILGLGAGTLAKIIGKKFPQVKMVGVEIDPAVVEIGKKYFGLNEIPNLKIVVGDAIDLVQSSKFKMQSFDLVVVDLYLGQEFPREAESESFFQDLQKIMAPDGLAIFNRLYYRKDHQREADQFVLKVKKFFQVKTKKAVTNLLIFASLEAKFGV